MTKSILSHAGKVLIYLAVGVFLATGVKECAALIQHNNEVGAVH